MVDRAIKLAGWATRWGFAALVSLGAVAAAWVAWQVAIPPPIPAFALQAAPVYRLEVGVATFAAVYLAATALGLALNNRAFSEIGASGVKAEDLSGSSRTIRKYESELLALSRVVAEMRSKAVRNA